MLGPQLVGDLHAYEVDMPWFICRFVPGPGWPAVRDAYEAFARWMDLREPDPEGIGFSEFAGPISALGMELEAPDGTRMPVLQRALVWIRDDIARVRC